MSSFKYFYVKCTILLVIIKKHFFLVGIEKIGLRTISKILKDLGGWPVVEGGLWQVEQFQWVDTIGKFTDMGFSTDYFFQFYYGFNFTNIKDKLYTVSNFLLKKKSYKKCFKYAFTFITD